VLLGADTFRSIFTRRLRWKLFLNQIVEIGLLSQLVVVITGAFTGAVFSAQTFFQFNKLGMGSAVGAVVSVAICRELGPVLTALMVTGRVGAAMSAEIGTMKVTEQIDALRALRPDEFADAMYEHEFTIEPRKSSEISGAIEELTDRVWYDRHMVLRHQVETGKCKIIAKKDFAPFFRHSQYIRGGRDHLAPILCA